MMRMWINQIIAALSYSKKKRYVYSAEGIWALLIRSLQLHCLVISMLASVKRLEVRLLSRHLYPYAQSLKILGQRMAQYHIQIYKFIYFPNNCQMKAHLQIIVKFHNTDFHSFLIFHNLVLIKEKLWSHNRLW